MMKIEALLVLALALACSTPHAQAASAQVRVAATVLPRVSLDAVRQVPTITITEGDLQQGFVEVPAATQFELRSNTTSQLEVSGSAEWFRAVTVSGLPVPAMELARAASAVVILPAFIARFAGSLSFRFRLAPNARPGTYPWPLSLTVTPG
jgi:hypothetical protein